VSWNTAVDTLTRNGDHLRTASYDDRRWWSSGGRCCVAPPSGRKGRESGRVVMVTPRCASACAPPRVREPYLCVVAASTEPDHHEGSKGADVLSCTWGSGRWPAWARTPLEPSRAAEVGDEPGKAPVDEDNGALRGSPGQHRWLWPSCCTIVAGISKGK
jgi:hypothetical protein